MIEFAPPPKLWLPQKPAIVRAASLAEIERAKPWRGVLPGTVPIISGAAGEAVVQAVDDIFVPDATDQTVYTYSDVALSGSWTHLLIGVAARGTAARTVSTLTVQGNSATFGHRNQTGNQSAEVWAIANSTATPDIVVTMDGACNNCSIAVLAVTGLQSVTPTDTADDDTDPFDFALDCLAGGVLFATIMNSVGTPTCAWSSAGTPVEIADQVVETSFIVHAAYELIAADQTGYTLTGDVTSGSNMAGAACSYR